MKYPVLVFFIVSSSVSCAQENQKTNQQDSAAARATHKKTIGGGCDCCEGIYQDMPAQLNYETTIASSTEPGEPLEISGIIYDRNGTTPAPGVILYVYHTNAKGYYEPSKDETGCAKRHGHLRGWMKTNSKGEYKFHTIKPAPYPDAAIPAHIHPILKEPGKNDYYIDEFRFDNDPLLTAEERSKDENRGGSGIVKLSKNSSGVWVGKRNIVLGKNIPDYY